MVEIKDIERTKNSYNHNHRVKAKIFINGIYADKVVLAETPIYISDDDLLNRVIKELKNTN